MAFNPLLIAAVPKLVPRHPAVPWAVPPDQTGCINSGLFPFALVALFRYQHSTFSYQSVLEIKSFSSVVSFVFALWACNLFTSLRFEQQ